MRVTNLLSVICDNDIYFKLDFEYYYRKYLKSLFYNKKYKSHLLYI